MLIEFKVTNFRSIREQQTLSLVAAKSDKALPECVIDRDLPGLGGVRYLKGAAIYGANASGKSNILKAIKFVADFVRHSAVGLHPDGFTGAEPFRLDNNSPGKPSEFELTFVAAGVRYVFGFAVTSERVLHEYLIAFPKGAPQRWYDRVFNPETLEYEWSKPSTAFKQAKSLIAKTRENALFLSVGPQFNHGQLRTVYNWFQNHLRIIDLTANIQLLELNTAKKFNTPEYHERLLGLLRSADLGIEDVSIKLEEMTEEQLKQSPNLISSVVLSPDGPKTFKYPEIKLLHSSGLGSSVPFQFDKYESAGTRRYFSLIGPWVDFIDNGHTVFIDEIETSLHPLLVKELLKLFFSSVTNPNGAQVVFATHNPILLDNSFMRRDQIWFTEKTADGITNLYPLTDFQPRKDEALAKGYLAGRYGGIPFIPNGLNDE